MAKKVIIEKRGCGYGCLVTFAALIAIAVLIYVLSFVGAIAAGVGLWFLIRYIWRQYAQRRPDASFVKWGMKLAPITRKVLAGVLCAMVSICLLGTFLSASSTKESASQQSGSSASATSEQEADEEDAASADSGSAPAEVEAAGQSDQPSDWVDPSKADLQQFIDYYNSKASTPFVQTETFDPKDTSSPHYRREYRLSAWDGSQGVSGTIGTVSVDFVKYSSGIRMYAKAQNLDFSSIMSVFKDATPIFAPSVTAETLDSAEAKYMDSESLRNISLTSLDSHLNGYVQGTEMMIERF